MNPHTRSNLLRGVIVLVLVLLISLLTIQLSPPSRGERVSGERVSGERVSAAPASGNTLQTSTTERLAALEAQVAALTRRVAALEGAGGIKAPVAAPTRAAATRKPTVASNANVRRGPGTGYAIVRTLRAGETLTLVARNGDAGDAWYQLVDGAWIYGTLVQNVPSGLPYAAAPASDFPHQRHARSP